MISFIGGTASYTVVVQFSWYFMPLSTITQLYCGYQFNWYSMPLSTVAQLYCGGRFYWSFNIIVNSISVIPWWWVLLMFSTTVNNNSVIPWWSVLLVFNATVNNSSDILLCQWASTIKMQLGRWSSTERTSWSSHWILWERPFNLKGGGGKLLSWL